MMMMLNKNVVMPVDISVSISLLPLVQDLTSTAQFAFGLQNRMWPCLRKYPSPISILTVMESSVPSAAPSVPILKTATRM